MLATNPIPAVTDANPADPTDDWAEQHVRMLRELAELGMALARSVARRALAEAEGDQADGTPADGAGGPGGDPGLAFSRVARAVRLTLSLEARVREGRSARQARAADEQAARRETERWRALFPPPVPYAPREAEVHRVIEQALEAEYAESADVDDRMSDMFDRLEGDDAYAGYGDRPIGETVARICRDLGLRPDWSLWADADWAVEEARDNTPGSPYAAAAVPP